MQTTRRRLLESMGATTLAAVAGCTTGDGGDGNESAGTGTEAAGNGSTEATAAPDPSSPEEAARGFVADLFDGRYKRAHDRFADAYKSELSPALIERTRIGLNAAGGEFRSITDTETEVVSGLQSVLLTLELERTTAPLRVNTTEDAELAGYVIDGEYERASYVDSGAFAASEHTLEPGGCQLGATLTTPADVEEAPGVVLVHGSGPSDRDGTTFANKPYRDVAEGLSSRGVAVLRYDKRTQACNVPAAEHTVDRVTVEDALHAIDWLRDRESVDAENVTVVGHSLGAMMAPDIAARDGNLAGAVGLAAPARPLTEVFLDQIEHLASVGELTPEGYETQRNRWQRAAEQIHNDNYDDDESLLGMPGAFWRSLEDYDPVARAESLSIPQFYLQGGRDYQVTPEDDFAAWRAAFEGADSVALSAYDPLNHAFLPGEGPSVPAAYAVPNEVSEAAVTDLADWITG